MDIETKNKRPRIVGEFIRNRREALGLSQRALGQLFSPPVTTQFISNVERGVTPLPPIHVATLTAVLKVDEAEIMGLLEREYTLKLSERLGKHDEWVYLSGPDSSFMRNVYEAYCRADVKTKESFTSACESILNVAKRLES